MGSTQSTWFSECFNLIKNDYFQQIHISESMGFYFSTDPTRLLLCRSGLHIIIQSPGLILHRHLVIFVYLNRLKGCLVDCRLVMCYIFLRYLVTKDYISHCYPVTAGYILL